MVFICPICKRKLENAASAYHCKNGHSYDVSAQGYVYLLPPNKMHSKIQGNSRQMVTCPREFLETGLYLPFSNQFNYLTENAVRDKKTPVIVDAGCGEGYYTRAGESTFGYLGNQSGVCRI